MSKILAKLAPYRKAIIGALVAGGAVLASEGTVDWKAVARAALAALVGGGGVFGVPNKTV